MQAVDGSKLPAWFSGKKTQWNTDMSSRRKGQSRKIQEPTVNLKDYGILE